MGDSFMRSDQGSVLLRSHGGFLTAIHYIFYIVFFITAIVCATFVTFLYTYILSLIACGRFVLTCSHPRNTYVFNAVFIIGNVFIFSIVVYISPIVTVIVIIGVLFSVFQRRGWK